uniref:(northern house mosquito) hypothetical protein n=1 Tax=Culex pipiens TaxID=7175 RepID=A0A8D8HB16_CULPI
MGGVQALPEEHRPDAVGGHSLSEHGVPGLLDRFQPVAVSLVHGCRGRERHQRTGHVPRSVRRVRCWTSHHLILLRPYPPAGHLAGGGQPTHLIACGRATAAADLLRYHSDGSHPGPLFEGYRRA